MGEHQQFHATTDGVAAGYWALAGTIGLVTPAV